MKRIFIFMSCLLLILPGIAFGEKIDNKINTAFIRDGYLWTKMKGKKERITNSPGQYPHPPQWSHDGKWILYQKEVQENLDVQSEIWVYNIVTKKHKQIFYDGYSPKWSPTENIIAFQSRGVLNISDLNKFYNVALGVDDFNWYPDGKSFIASSGAQLRPDGWTNPVLYKIPIGDSLENIKLANAKPLFTIPKELTNGKASIMSINASIFEFSQDGKWISFIVTPTASLSMDSDMVCVISADGKDFTVLDEMILHLDDPKWAPDENLLGYIAGGGRIVAGFKNKNLKITELPAFKSLNLTPPKYAEMAFTWVDNDSLIVSRVRESEWSNDLKKRPKPSLYLINMDSPKQEKIIAHDTNRGDYQPEFLQLAGKLTWKKGTLTDLTGDVWIADANGKNAKKWISNVDQYSFFVIQ